MWTEQTISGRAAMVSLVGPFKLVAVESAFWVVDGPRATGGTAHSIEHAQIAAVRALRNDVEARSLAIDDGDMDAILARLEALS